MGKFTQGLMATAVVVILIGGFSLLIPSADTVQGAPVKDVNVVNTPTVQANQMGT